MPFDKSGAYIVTVDGGAMFRCHVEMVGKEGKYPDYIRRRWIFQRVGEGDPRRHIGPLFFPIGHERELQRIVVEWWTGGRIVDDQGERDAPDGSRASSSPIETGRNCQSGVSRAIGIDDASLG